MSIHAPFWLFNLNYYDLHNAQIILTYSEIEDQNKHNKLVYARDFVCVDFKINSKT